MRPPQVLLVLEFCGRGDLASYMAKRVNKGQWDQEVRGRAAVDVLAGVARVGGVVF